MQARAATGRFLTAGMLAVAAALALYVSPSRPSRQADESPDRAAHPIASFDPALCRTPAQCARTLNALFQERRFAELAPMISEQNRQATLALLAAAAEILDANDRLRRAAVDAYHLADCDVWDLGALRDNLGVFSKNPTLISEKYVGADAIVTLQEGGNVPLIRARFTPHGAGWVLVPGPTPPELPARLLELAASLREVEAIVRSGIPYLEYVQLFYDRALPHMREIVGPPGDDSSVAAAEHAAD